MQGAKGNALKVRFAEGRLRSNDLPNTKPVLVVRSKPRKLAGDFARSAGDGHCARRMSIGRRESVMDYGLLIRGYISANR